MKVFISLPMRGYSKDDIEDRFSYVENIVIAKHGPDTEIVGGICSDDKLPLEKLGEALITLASCDAAYFAYDWGTARGCVIEKNACELYGIPSCELEEM